MNASQASLKLKGYSKALDSARSDIIPLWDSPRHSGTLNEEKSNALHYIRDQDMLVRMRDRLANIVRQEDKALQSSKSCSVRQDSRKRRALVNRLPALTQSSGKNTGTARTHIELPSADTKASSLASRSSNEESSKTQQSQYKFAPVQDFQQQDPSQAEEMAEKTEKARREKANERRLIRTLRRSLQQHLDLSITRDLAMRLWKEFRKGDSSGDGRLCIAEFSAVCERLGVGADVVGQSGLDILFKMADTDKTGGVDYNEFLNTLVGNYVSL